MVRHKCDNTRCVNPDHLEIGTKKQNSQDMVKRGRSLHGIRHPSSKLSEDEVVKILIDQKTPGAELAMAYGVSEKAISDIKLGKRWKKLISERGLGRYVKRTMKSLQSELDELKRRCVKSGYGRYENGEFILCESHSQDT